MGDPVGMDTASAYDARGLVKSYRGATTPANDGIDLQIAAGEIVGLLGPNGAGKSTLVRQLVGIIRPDAGTIHCFGQPIDRTASRAAISYLAQTEPALADMSVHIAVTSTGRLRGMDRKQAAGAADAVIDELGIAALAKRPIARLSGGQARLAALAAALVGDRPLLVLDEPTTGLDVAARRLVWSALSSRRQQLGTTVVLVTHNVTEAETLLDRVAVLDAGRVIACDTPGRLKASISAEVRLEIVWLTDPPVDDATVEALRARSVVDGRRWSARLPAQAAQELLGRVLTRPLVDSLDDFKLSTPSLEDVFLSMGHGSGDLERV